MLYTFSNRDWAAAVGGLHIRIEHIREALQGQGVHKDGKFTYFTQTGSVIARLATKVPT